MDKEMIKYALWFIGLTTFFYLFILSIILITNVYYGEPLYPLYSMTGGI